VFPIFPEYKLKSTIEGFLMLLNKEIVKGLKAEYRGKSLKSIVDP